MNQIPREPMEAPNSEPSPDSDDPYTPPEKITAWARAIRMRLEETRKTREQENAVEDPLANLPIPDERHFEGRERSFRELLEETGRGAEEDGP